LGESKIAALDLASNYDELAKFTREKLNEEFKTLGLELTKFVIENISLPQEVEAAMDKRTSMGVIGDVGRYAQFQAADAMRDAAQNTGGGAGTGAGLGAGFAIGNAMAGAMGDALRQPKSSDGVVCPKCGSDNLRGAKFCNDCGATLEAQKQTVPCVKCGAALQPGTKFCNECGVKQEKQACPNCKAELSPSSKFCNECGQQV
jgi:membrane protease subunit (stomatin/prohibitin family)